MRCRIPVIIAALFFAASGSILLALPAQAHRDGCHRWHSCPSDTLTGSANRLDHEISNGTYNVKLVATGNAGNVTARAVRVVVPLSSAQWAVGLGVLLVGAGALGTGMAWVWRNRARIGAWQQARSDAAELRAAERKAAAAATAYQGLVLQHQAAQSAYESALTRWRRKGNDLAYCLRLAECETGSVSAHLDEVRLRPGERVFLVSPAHLLEERSRGGLLHLTVTGTGKAVVTDRRTVFVGNKDREWTFDKLQGAELSTDTALLRVTNRQALSGIRFSEGGERACLLLRLAIADHTGSRSDVVGGIRDQIRDHNASRPPPPTPPEPLHAPEPSHAPEPLHAPEPPAHLPTSTPQDNPQVTAQHTPSQTPQETPRAANTPV